MAARPGPTACPLNADADVRKICGPHLDELLRATLFAHLPPELLPPRSGRLDGSFALRSVRSDGAARSYRGWRMAVAGRAARETVPGDTGLPARRPCPALR